MKLAELLAGKPSVRVIKDARSIILKYLKKTGTQLAVIDDDPTGTQTVHGLRVYLEWTKDVLISALATGDSVFFVSTNSRALSADDAKELSFNLGTNLKEACKPGNNKVVIASRSDSTLRGHFPYEVMSLAEGLGENPDGIIIAPAFFEAGRYTIDDIHWVDVENNLVPANETEFAKDPNFGFLHGNLRDWVEEKTKGAVTADKVVSISLETIRDGGSERVTELLMSASESVPIIINAACYEDLEVAAIGILVAQEQGKKFAYRCAACLVKVMGGINDMPLLKKENIQTGNKSGLIMVGSYVDKTSRQLSKLLDSEIAEGIELQVDALFEDFNREETIAKVVKQTEEKLSSGKTAVIYTSRSVQSAKNEKFLQIGNIIMNSLCKVINNIGITPGFVVAKGGITSSEIARIGLSTKDAYVMGQILPGVSVWSLGKHSKWPGTPYIVFPGNVGDDSSLYEAVKILQS